MRKWLLLATAASWPALAQSDLTLQDAIRSALQKHPAMQVRAAESRAADARITQARSGYMPRVSYAESFARSDNPVFVFSSLLTQHQFAERNFAIGPLNRPNFLNNFQSLVTADQTVYDWGATASGIRSAELARGMTDETRRGVELELTARVVRAYYGTVLANAALETARASLKSAEADLQRAETVRKAGMSTDADVLSIRVHVATIREAEIRRGYEARIALAALNEAMGLPLDTPHALSAALTPAVLDTQAAERFEKAAAGARPELKMTALATQIAEQKRIAARSALLPQIGVRGAFEADRQRFVDRGGANWLISASLRWNLFDGSLSRARIKEAEAAADSARAQSQQATSGIRLEVQKAWSEYRSAAERIEVASAAVTQAEESLRITKNRYEAGLATITDLLRTETALLDTRTRRLAAIHDQRIAAAQLELAAGTLNADSEALR